MRLSWCVAAVAVLLGPAACGGEADGGDQPTGSVHGTIQMTGGPMGASPAGAAGTVVVTRKGHEVQTQDVAEGGEFRFSLPAGSYRLAVDGVSGACEAAGVTVSAGNDQAVTLICQRK